jgi:hypothetical protein
VHSAIFCSDFFLLSEVGPWCIWFLSWTFGLSMTVSVECEGTTCRETFTDCSDQILYLLISLLRNRGPPPGDQDQNGDASRGRGPPRRFFRRNFRGGRGGGRRPHSQDSQGQAGEQVGQDGPRGQQRSRYRRRGPPRPRGGNSQSESGNNYSKPSEVAGPVKTEESQPVQNTTTESTA